MLLPDKKTRMALGGSIADVVMYYDSLRKPVEKTGVVDDLLGADITGTCVNNAFVERGEGFRFDGASYASVDDTNFIEPTTKDFWFSLWFRMNSKPTALRGIFGQFYSATGDRWGLFQINDTPFRILCSAFPQAVVYSPTISNADVAVDRWYHTGVIYDRSASMRLYIDGEYIGGSSITSCSDSITPPVVPYIGCYPDGGRNPANYFDGDVDKIMYGVGGFAADKMQAIFNAQRHLFGV